MTLSARQQAILDQIERALAAADPQLKSKFGIFTRLTSRDTMPETETVPADERQRSRAKSMVGLLVVFRHGGQPGRRVSVQRDRHA